MICNKISDVLGFTCHPLDDLGKVAMIQTPFTFGDGDELPVFVEQVGTHLRFFDDGEFYMHFRGRGMNLSTATQTRFIKTAAELHGGTFTASGELEVWAEQHAAHEGFAHYIGAAMALLQWERDHVGVGAETSVFIEEVAQCLAAWKPAMALTREPKIEGITGKLHEFAFSLNGTVVAAVSPHHTAVSAVLHKLLDIKAKPENAHIKTLVVLDDRQDKQAALRENMVINGVSEVIVMTRLQKQSGLTAAIQ